MDYLLRFKYTTMEVPMRLQLSRTEVQIEFPSCSEGNQGIPTIEVREDGTMLMPELELTTADLKKLATHINRRARILSMNTTLKEVDYE